jgi:hypothetical protein
MEKDHSLELLLTLDYGALLIFVDKTEDFAQTFTNGKENQYIYVGRLPLDNLKFIDSKIKKDKLTLGLNTSINKVTDLGNSDLSINLGKAWLNVNKNYLHADLTFFELKNSNSF